MIDKVIKENKIQDFLDDKYISIKKKNEKSKIDEEKENNRFLLSMGTAMDLGIAIALPLVGGAALGSYLDKKFNTYPKLTLFLIFLGLILSFVNIFVIVKKNLDN